MFNSGRKTIGFGLAAGLVIASAVGLTSMTSAESNTPPEPTYLTINLELDERSGTVTYQPLVGDELVQTIVTGDPCAKIESSGADLLTFTPGGTGTSVQLPRGGLGVESGSNCGNNAAFVSDGQILTVGLGSVFGTSADGFTTSIVSADLEILTNADAELKATYNGKVDIRTVSPNPDFVRFPETEVGSFTSIQLEPENGRPKSRTGVSLLGGEFAIEIPDGSAALACEEFLTVDGATGDIADSATFLRLKNLDKGNGKIEECETGDVIGAIIQITDELVRWDNTPTGTPGQTEQALFTIEWAGVASSGYQTPERLINYEGDPDGEFFEVEWCISYDNNWH